MTIHKARLIVILLGVFVPYVSRIPRGTEWLQQYTDVGLTGWLFFGAFNAIAWGSILAASLKYQRPSSLLPPSILGFGFLAWAHYSLDLAADAQAAIALIFIPIIALGPILIGVLIGNALERSS